MLAKQQHLLFDEQEREVVPLISERKLLAVQALWSRYGMHEPWAALSDWHAIHNGARYYPEQVDEPAARADFPDVRQKGVLPLTVYTGEDAAQLTNVAGAISGANARGDSSVEADVLQPLNSQSVFDVDKEGAELFVWILGPDILEKSRDADLITAVNYSGLKPPRL